MFRILFQGDLFADYFQIYLHDVDHPTLPTTTRTRPSPTA